MLENTYEYKKIKANFLLGSVLQNAVLGLLRRFYLHGTGKGSCFMTLK